VGSAIALQDERPSAGIAAMHLDLFGLWGKPETT